MADQNQKKYGNSQTQNENSDNRKKPKNNSLCFNLEDLEPTSVTFIVTRKRLDSMLEGLARAAFGDVAMAEFCVREDDDSVEFDPKSRTTRKKVIVEPIVWLDASNPNIAAQRDDNSLINVPIQQYSGNYKKFVSTYCDSDCKNPYKDNITKRTRDINGRKYRAIRCSVTNIVEAIFDINGTAYKTMYNEPAVDCDIAIYDMWSSGNHNSNTFKGLKIVKSASNARDLKDLLSGKQAFAPKAKKRRDEDEDDD